MTFTDIVSLPFRSHQVTVIIGLSLQSQLEAHLLIYYFFLLYSNVFFYLNGQSNCF